MEEFNDQGPEYAPVEFINDTNKPNRYDKSEPVQSRSSNQLLELVKRFDKGEVVTNEEIISNYVDPEFMQNLMLFNIKVAENGMLNSAKIIHKLEAMVDDLIDRLDDPASLTMEQLTAQLGVLFEMQNRYQNMIEKILNEDSYKYYLENLAAVRRLVESRAVVKPEDKEEMNNIYDNEVDRKLVYELVSDIKKSLSTSSTSNELVNKLGGDDNNGEKEGEGQGDSK